MNVDEFTNKAYLGDGVYAGFDGYHIWVYTDAGMLIALEPSVMDTLIAYRNHLPPAAGYT